MIETYTKKPVQITAIRYTATNVHEILDWLTSFGVTADDSDDGLHIHTLEGRLHASLGDYIIRGIADEAYACKPDIFAATYDPTN